MNKPKYEINDYDFAVKLIMIGESGVGKTNIITRFAEDKFNENFLTTVGVDWKIKTI